MYLVHSALNLQLKIVGMLHTFFGDKAEVTNSRSLGKIYVKVKEDAGFKDKNFPLTPEQLAEGVVGGGVVLGLDGKTFCIQVTELPEKP